jgi:hypothetical protein
VLVAFGTSLVGASDDSQEEGADDTTLAALVEACGQAAPVGRPGQPPQPGQPPVPGRPGQPGSPVQGLDCTAPPPAAPGSGGSAPVEGGRTVQTASGTTITIVAMRDSRGNPIEDTNDRVVEINSEIAGQVQALFLAAEADPSLGGDLVVVSSFRDAATQIELWNDCNSSCRARGMVAQPGQSLHEQGKAIDFGCGNGELMGRGNKCYEWLRRHGEAYGLRELCRGDEPWHWSATCG